MRIFISHASEDKADFVRPLAEALRKEYEVWYDEYELTMGDSLFKRINEGLVSCDFGVVVLSQAFFSKKWPPAELDGLFALETTTRKIILPVWKNISEKEVKRFSPILAGRFAAQASDGVEKVVGEIQRAIDVSNRTRQISALDSAIQKARAVDQSLKERSNQERLSHGEEGVALVQQAVQTLVSVVKSSIAEIKQSSGVLQLSLRRPLTQDFGVLRVTSNNNLTMNVDLIGLGANYTYEAVLHVVIFEDEGIFHHGGAPKIIRSFEFRPTFRLPQHVVWLGTGTQALSTEELAGHALERLLEEVARQAK